MEHSQFKVIYYPKKDTDYNIQLGINSWVTTGVDLYSYLDFNCQETTENKQDGSNLPFLIKTYYEGNGTYNSGTRVYTFTGTSWATDKWKWHTLIDSLNNRYVIESNTADTITLASASDFNFYGTPQTGNVKITIPDFEEDDIFHIIGWKITDGVYAEPADFGDKIIFVGQIISRTFKNDNRGSQVNLKLSNMTELLLKTTQMWEVEAGLNLDGHDYSGVTGKIKYILDTVNGRNAGTIQVTWDGDNPTTKIDGNAFLDERYFKDESPASDVIYDLCKPEHTGDVVEYYVYLKPTAVNNFNLVWRPKKITSTTEIVEGTDFDFLSFANDKAEIISGLIFRCGIDCNRHNVTQIVYGDFRKGSRQKKVAADLCGDIIREEITTNRESFNPEVNLYPLSYNYTTAISVTQAEVDAVVGSLYDDFLSHTGTYTVTSNTEFNKFVKYLAKSRAIIRGKNFLRKNNTIRDQIVVRFYATPAANIPGSTKKFTIYTIGWTGGAVGQKDYRKNLRLSNKIVGVDKNGIYTECTYLEDEGDTIE